MYSELVQTGNMAAWIWTSQSRSSMSTLHNNWWSFWWKRQFARDTWTQLLHLFNVYIRTQPGLSHPSAKSSYSCESKREQENTSLIGQRKNIATQKCFCFSLWGFRNKTHKRSSARSFPVFSETTGRPVARGAKTAHFWCASSLYSEPGQKKKKNTSWSCENAQWEVQGPCEKKKSNRRMKNGESETLVFSAMHVYGSESCLTTSDFPLNTAICSKFLNAAIWVSGNPAAWLYHLSASVLGGRVRRVWRRFLLTGPTLRVSGAVFLLCHEYTYVSNVVTTSSGSRWPTPRS